jgi:hypothetical protein
MQTTYEPRNTSQELSDRIKGHVEELANATDAARLSDVIQNYLKAASVFHQYSFNNILLINFAYPCATRVAGFQAWRKLNRWVRKGESGIPILAPIVVKEKTEGSEEKSFLRGFKVVYVFDISQTDGDPLPEPPEWKSPERSAELQYRLMTFARKKSIVVTVKKLAGEIQGVSKGGAIDIAPDAGTSTLLHELAHELLHRGPDAPSESGLRELEAESVAWVCSRHFGLESSGSPNYIALHGNSAELIMKHLERIRKVAAEIIEAVQTSCEEALEKPTIDQLSGD